MSKLALDNVKFIHIGMPKAASTWLQYCLFKQVPKIRVVGDCHIDKNDESDFIDILTYLMYASELHLDVDLIATALNRLCLRALDDLQQHNVSEKILGISHEMLTGRWPDGGNTVLIAKTLKTLFPNAKIIFMFREQKSHIRSTYMQYLKTGGTASFENFLMNPSISNGYSKTCKKLVETNVVNYFKYSQYIKLYSELFGAANVLSVPMEIIRKNYTEVACDILNFIGQPKTSTIKNKEMNVQLHPMTLLIGRQTNKLFKSSVYGADRFTPIGDLLSLFYRMSKSHPHEEDSDGINEYWHDVVIQSMLASNCLTYIDKVVKTLFKNQTVNLCKYEKLDRDFYDWLINLYKIDNTLTKGYCKYDLHNLGYAM